ncbi:hypothetical protein [Bartonella sp. WD16.2]|nr:hypothetical protein [Bartonella sp. WD16.2]
MGRKVGASGKKKADCVGERKMAFEDEVCEEHGLERKGLILWKAA